MELFRCNQKLMLLTTIYLDVILVVYSWESLKSVQAEGGEIIWDLGWHRGWSMLDCLVGVGAGWGGVVKTADAGVGPCEKKWGPTGKTDPTTAHITAQATAQTTAHRTDTCPHNSLTCWVGRRTERAGGGGALWASSDPDWSVQLCQSLPVNSG